MKETFIVRTEWYASICQLKERDQATILKNLFEYHAGNVDKVKLSSDGVRLVWSLIEPNLKRNIEHYDKRRETSAVNGKKGGRPLKEEKPNKPNLKPNKPNETLSVFDSVFDTDSDIPLSPNILEAAELNQHTLTKERNTEFIKTQWQVFLKERSNDPPERQRQLGRPGEMGRYFLNWIRNKHPKKNGTHLKAVNNNSEKPKPGTSEARINGLRNW